MPEFIFFIYIAILGGVSSFAFYSRISTELNKLLYFSLSFPLIIFTAFRPAGLMRDDSWYEMTIPLIQSYTLTDKVFSLRDPLWYLMTHLLTMLSEKVEVIFYLSGLILFLKLLILYKTAANNRLLALFVYACVFWQLHDLTQLRVSVSVLMFMLFFYHIRLNRKKFATALLILSAFFHAQALLNFFLLINTGLLKKKFFITIVCGSIFAIASGFIVNSSVINLLGITFFGDINDNEIARTLNSYQEMFNSGLYANTLHLPLILLASSIVYMLVINSIDNSIYLQPITQQVAKSIAFALILSWAFASISDIQVRFYEYYFVSGLFLLENVRCRVAFNAYLILAILYFSKFNILWNIWDIKTFNSLL